MKFIVKQVYNMDKVVSNLTAIFVFILMVDPSDRILRLKIPLFVLLIGCCLLLYKKIDKIFYMSIALYSILIVTSIIGFLSFFNVDSQTQMQFYKTFIMTLLLCWISRLRFLERLTIPAIIIGLIVLFVYVVALTFPVLSLAIAGFLSSDMAVGTIMVSKREFLGIPIIAVYYTSAPVLLMLFAVSYYRLMSSTKNRLKLFTLCLVISLSLLLGGTRAMMLSCVAIILILTLLKMWWSRIGRIIVLISIPILTFCAVLFIGILLSDKGEESLEVKTRLIEAFYRHVENNPSTLIIGNGMGATFDSLGVRGPEAGQSELTYLELVRWFGIPLGIAFLFIYLYPIVLIYRKRSKLPYHIAIILSYFFYLLLSGTNPYLVGSNGMLALLTAYSYALNPYYENKEW